MRGGVYYRFLLNFLLIALGGCWERPDAIVGVVGTVDDLAESCILARPELDKSIGEKPIAGASVFLAYDEKGQEKVKGFEAKTGKDGKYRISTKGIPPSKTSEENHYFLVVKKDGFMPLIQEMNIGAKTYFIRNSVFLKPIPRKGSK